MTMTMTAEQLTDRIDPALAVDRVLTPEEREVFTKTHLGGRFEGAGVADWLDQALDSDAYVQQTDPWWEQYGDRSVDRMRRRFGLPVRLCRNLLGAALVFNVSIALASAGTLRTHIEIADDAALWTLGYAERCGWTPGDEPAAT